MSLFQVAILLQGGKIMQCFKKHFHHDYMNSYMLFYDVHSLPPPPPPPFPPFFCLLWNNLTKALDDET